MDPVAVEQNYLECLTKGESNILPLLLDLTNPIPGMGWENQERISLIERGPADTVLALVLIHHSAISNNNAQVIVITAGVKQKPGESRLHLLKRNTTIIENIANNIPGQDS